MAALNYEDEFTKHGSNAYYLRRQDRDRPGGRLPGENRREHRKRVKDEKRNFRPARLHW